MSRRALPALSALLVVLAVLALPVAAGADARPLRVRLSACRHGTAAVDRYLQTTSTVRLVPRSARVVLRYELFSRPAGAPSFSRYPAPPFERGFRRASEHVYTVGNLPARAAYRLRVRARWLARGGRVVRRAQWITPVCRQPDQRPDLVVADFLRRGPDRFLAVVRNLGPGAAGSFSVVGVAVPGLAAGAAVRVPVPACAEVSVDPAGAVDERNEHNNSARAPCPAAVARMSRARLYFTS